MHAQTEADELAQVRAEIAQLKAREAELRAGFIAAPGTGASGRSHRVEVLETRARVFDAQPLPPAIRNDPRYWVERVTTTVRCAAVQSTQTSPRGGWPRGDSAIAPN